MWEQVAIIKLTQQQTLIVCKKEQITPLEPTAAIPTCGTATNSFTYIITASNDNLYNRKTTN